MAEKKKTGEKSPKDTRERPAYKVASFATEVKALDGLPGDDGMPSGDSLQFEGYAAVTGVKDSDDDIIEAGAFAKQLASIGNLKKIKVLWQHDRHNPIGFPLEMREDDNGLYVRAQLVDTPENRSRFALIKAGVVDKMSIGYRAKKYAYEDVPGDDFRRIRRIQEIEVMEFSPVTFPANEYAVITAAKAATEGGKAGKETADDIELTEITTPIERPTNSDRESTELQAAETKTPEGGIAMENEIKELKAAFDLAVKGMKDEIASGATETKAMKDRLAEIEGLKARITELELAARRPATGTGGEAAKKRQTVGQAFTADETKCRESFEKFGRHRMEVKDANLLDMQQKALSSASYTALQAIGGERVPVIEELPKQKLTIRQKLMAGTTSADTITFVRKTAKYAMYTTVKTTANSGQKNVVVQSIAGFFVGQTITLNNGTNSETAIVATVTPSTTDDSGTIVTTANLTYTHTAGLTSEVYSTHFTFTARTKLKPLGEMVLENVTVPVCTLATGIEESNQVLDDYPRLRSVIDMDLMNDVAVNEEREILFGTGANSMMLGIMNTPNILTISWSAGEVGDTRIDCIRRAITLASKVNVQVNGLVVSPDDLEELELTKDEYGRYLLVPDISAGGNPRIWRLDIMESNSMPAGTCLVGAFGTGAKIWDRQRSSIEVFREHKDNAARNMVYIRAEERLALQVGIPQSFCKVTLDSAPVAPSA